MEEELELSEGIDAAQDYKTQSELNDMRQHANKIIQGIKKLDHNDASRAVWELFQNAVDLANESHIEIELSQEEFIFRHNGEPFTPMTLDCLFKQVSSKTLEEKSLLVEDNDPIGQYGTGFMTSHIFGKQLSIDGALVKGKGIVPFKGFVIDRDTDNWKQLAIRISALKEEVEQLLKVEAVDFQSYRGTTFTYKMVSKGNRDWAESAVDSLATILPYVMTFNPKLASVKVKTHQGEFLYEKGKIDAKAGMNIRTININGKPREICYLENEEEKISMVLPLTSNLEAFDLDQKLPRLFLYYPLVGTQDFGVNFVINSRRFQPLEPRNGIYLCSENQENIKEEQANQLLLEKASEMLFAFLKANIGDISSPIKLAEVNFKIDGENEGLNSYFERLKTEWINTFKRLKMVETDHGPIAPADTAYLHEELLKDGQRFADIHLVAAKYWDNLSIKSLIHEWTEKMKAWGINAEQWVTVADIVGKLEQSGSLEAIGEMDSLKEFYSYLIDNGHTEYFTSHKLLPNIKGEFRTFTGNEGLNRIKHISPELIAIADVIKPDIPKRHVHDEFRFNLDFVDYTREDFSSEINDEISRHISEFSISEELDIVFLRTVIQYAKVITTPDSTSVPTKMVKLVSRFYGENEEMMLIPYVQDEKLDVGATQKKLVRLLLNDIAKKDVEWVAANLSTLKDIMEVCIGNSYYIEFFKTLPVFPNVLNELALQHHLKIGTAIPDVILDLYDHVVKPDCPIRSDLLHPEFVAFAEDKNSLDVNALTNRIEAVFFDREQYKSIEEHPFKKEIMEIIDEIKETEIYKHYFPLVYSNRSKILLELADGDDTFTILSLETQRIKDLAVLGKNPNFSDIVRLGKEALLRLQQESASFQYKKYLGNHIEKILRNNLTRIIPEKIKAKVLDVQGGQDIIITIDEEPVYYLEVKSRWNSDYAITISKNQTIKAELEKDRYALCTVDMTRYTGEDKLKVGDVQEIVNCIHFNEDIGYKVGHLVDLLNKTGDPDTFHLSGDYNTLVPMKFINAGKSLSEFEHYLLQYIEANVEIKP